MGRVSHTVGMPAVLFLCSRLKCIGFIFQESMATGLLLLLLLLRARRTWFAVAILCPMPLVGQLWGGSQVEIKFCLAFCFFRTEEVWQVVVGQVFAR